MPKNNYTLHECGVTDKPLFITFTLRAPFRTFSWKCRHSSSLPPFLPSLFLCNSIPHPPIKSFVRARRLTTPPPTPATLSIGSGRDSSVVGSLSFSLPPFLLFSPFFPCFSVPPGTGIVVVVVIHNRNGVVVGGGGCGGAAHHHYLSDRARGRGSERLKPRHRRSALFSAHPADQRLCIMGARFLSSSSFYHREL